MDNWYDNQNQNNNPYNRSNPYGRPVYGEPKGFAIATLVCGIASIVTMYTGILPIMIGALGLVFFFLGKRLNKPVQRLARTGLTLTLCGMLSGAALTGYTLYELGTNAQFRELVIKQYEAMENLSGSDITLDDYLKYYGMTYEQ